MAFELDVAVQFGKILQDKAFSASSKILVWELQVVRSFVMGEDMDCEMQHLQEYDHFHCCDRLWLGMVSHPQTLMIRVIIEVDLNVMSRNGLFGLPWNSNDHCELT